MIAAEDLKTLTQTVTIDLIIVQSSVETKFTLARVLRLKDTLDDVLSIHREPKDFSEAYNERLSDAIQRFRVTHRVLARKLSALSVSIFYATKGDAEKILKIPNDVKRKADAIEIGAPRILNSVSACKFTFLGARELVELARKPPKITYNLRCFQTIPSDHGGYVSLVKLRDFYRFITDGGTQLIDHLFDSNVRDYQGDVEVNKAIRGTLAQSKEDFWWLNNGITIVATKAGGDLLDLVIDEPRIVNGLQTSQEIFDYFSGNRAALDKDNRYALVRTISSTDSETRDRIIEATNSQTGMQPASLWATDPIHRDLEKLFPRVGLYYDRRKNYWRNRNVHISQIVGITELAQSVIAVVLRAPDDARARPARYFKKADKEKEKARYEDVFNARRYPIDIYVVCAQLRKKVEKFLRTVEPDRQHRNNLLFYVLMTAACLATKANKPTPNRLSKIDVSAMTDSLMTDALGIVRPIYKRLGATDKVAKGTELLHRLKRKLERDLVKPRAT